MKQFSRGIDIKTLVSDMKILCSVDQDVQGGQGMWEGEIGL